MHNFERVDRGELDLSAMHKLAPPVIEPEGLVTVEPLAKVVLAPAIWLASRAIRRATFGLASMGDQVHVIGTARQLVDIPQPRQSKK